MDRIAEMYGVTTQDTIAERIVPVGLAQNMGRLALATIGYNVPVPLNSLGGV